LLLSALLFILAYIIVWIAYKNSEVILILEVSLCILYFTLLLMERQKAKAFTYLSISAFYHVFFFYKCPQYLENLKKVIGFSKEEEIYSSNEIAVIEQYNDQMGKATIQLTRKKDVFTVVNAMLSDMHKFALGTYLAVFCCLVFVILFFVIIVKRRNYRELVSLKYIIGVVGAICFVFTTCCNFNVRHKSMILVTCGIGLVFYYEKVLTYFKSKILSSFVGTVVVLSILFVAMNNCYPYIYASDKYELKKLEQYKLCDTLVISDGFNKRVFYNAVYNMDETVQIYVIETEESIQENLLLALENRKEVIVFTTTNNDELVEELSNSFSVLRVCSLEDAEVVLVRQ